MTGPRPASDAWTVDDDRTLMAMIEAKTDYATIARKLKRSIGAIQSRRSKLRQQARHQRSAMVEATDPTSCAFTPRASLEPYDRDAGRGGDAAAD